MKTKGLSKKDLKHLDEMTRRWVEDFDDDEEQRVVAAASFSHGWLNCWNYMTKRMALESKRKKMTGN
jgi:hypothetical protein